MNLDLAAVVRDTVRADSLSALASAVTDHLASSRSVVLARVWFRDSDALSLAGSAGTPSGGGSYNRLDGEFRQTAIADAKIAEIANSRVPFVVRVVRGDEDWLINPPWAARQGVRAFLAFPLVADQNVRGVLAALDRDMPDDELILRLTLVAEIVAHRSAELARRTASDLCPSQPPPSLPERDGGAGEGRRTPELLTRADLRRIEKQNIEAALARTGGKVFGPGGAAELLGMRPTTLASRVKALGIR